MPGFISSISNNEEIVFAKNVDFSGAQNPSNTITQDGQLLIGGTALNVGGTHINVGTLSSSNNSIGITNGQGTIDLQVNSNSFSPNSCINIFDDFLPNTEIGQLNWNFFGGVQAVDALSGNNPGLYETADDAIAGIYLADNNWKNGFILGGGFLSFNFTFDLVTLSALGNRYVVNVGMMDTDGAIAPLLNGIYLSYSDDVNGGDWVLNCTSGGVTTSVNTAITASTGFHTCSFNVNANASNVTFYIDNAIAGSVITTNIPTTGINPSFFVSRSSGALPLFLIDLFWLSYNLTNPRLGPLGSCGSDTDLHTARYIVSAGGLADGANYTTITSAYAAAVAAGAPQTVFIQPGTYTENLTLTAGINLCGMASSIGLTAPIILKGKQTLAAGIVYIDNITLQTNGDYIYVVSGSATINSERCQFLNSSHAFSCDLGNLNFFQCNLNDSGPGSGAWFTCVNTSTIQIKGCNFLGTVPTASTFANTSAILISNSTYQGAITTSDTAQFQAYNSFLMNDRALTLGGTVGNDEIYNCCIGTTNNSSTFISVGAGATLTIGSSTIKTSNASPITGTGTVKLSGICFLGTSSTINTTTQTPMVQSNDAIKVVTPGAYPYTTVPQDAIILVDSSVARTIVPLALPTTGQKHIIKDSVGTASANNITVTPSGKNIDGSASFVINTNYGSINIVYNGSEWNVY